MKIIDGTCGVKVVLPTSAAGKFALKAAWVVAAAGAVALWLYIWWRVADLWLPQ